MSLRLIVACSLVTGCGVDSMSASTQPLPLTSGSFAGHYTVPMSPDLMAAGTFDVSRVDWAVSAGVVRLDYDLPEGLVGGKVAIELAGPIASGDTSVAVASERGTGTCSLAGSLVTCSEQLANLGTLPISVAVIEQRAGVEYVGPAADRLTVANVFGSDPIGTLTFDLAVPSTSGND